MSTLPERLAALLSVLLLAARSDGQAVVAKVDAPTLDYEVRFGHRTLLAGDLAFVTALGADEGGAVHVLARSASGWTTLSVLQPTDSAGGQVFGQALAFSGDTLLVGAPGDQDSAGAAYVTVRDDHGTPSTLDDTWGPLAKLVAAGVSPPRDFGWSVALDGDTALIGAPGPFGVSGFSNEGAAYVFVRDGSGAWTEQARFNPDVPSPSTALGAGVALLDAGTLALVSDPFDQGGSYGGVFLYERDDVGTTDPLDDTWSAAGQLEAPATPIDGMGGTLVAEGDTVICAGWYVGDLNQGRMYAFERSAGTWSLTDVIENPLAFLHTGLGRSMSLSGDVLVTGDMVFTFGPPSQGTPALVFRRSGSDWSHAATLRAPDETVGGGFGRAVSADGESALVGAPGGLIEDDWPSVLGSVYEVDLDSRASWASTQVGPAHPGLAGWGRVENGAPVSVRIFPFDTFPDLSSQAVFLVVGASAVNVPLFGSTLVPAPQLIRPVTLTAQGDARFNTHWPAGVPSGTQAWLQAWLPPNQPLHGWVASNGLVVTQP